MSPSPGTPCMNGGRARKQRTRKLESTYVRDTNSAGVLCGCCTPCSWKAVAELPTPSCPCCFALCLCSLDCFLAASTVTVAMATIHSKYFSDEPTREQWIAQLVEAERERRKRQRMKEAAAATGETYTMPQQQTQTDRLTPVLTAVPRYPAAAAPRTDRPEQPRP
jgi:hypothetical protein